MRGAPLVAFGLLGLEVLRAVYLHNQSRSRCVKIGDIITDGFLSVDLHALDLLPAQASPQTLLCVGRVGSQ